MKPDTLRTYRERILRVLVYIQGRLDDALDLDQLAGVAHFSPYHFHRVFRGMVGESVKEHVRRLRLERSAHRLKHGDAPITQLAFEAGYETHEAFTRAFRAMFGESPSGFRELHQALPLTDVPCGVHYAPDGKVDHFQPKQKGAEDMDARIEKIEPKHVAFIRHVGPYDQVGATWGRLMSWAGPRGLCGPNMKCLGITHDDPEVTPAEKIRYDACIEVGASFSPGDDVGVQEIPGGEYVVTTHHGPYEKLADTYARLCGEWVPTCGRELAPGPGFEVYHNSPMNTAPENLVTDIYMPLEPK